MKTSNEIPTGANCQDGLLDVTPLRLMHTTKTGWIWVWQSEEDGRVQNRYVSASSLSSSSLSWPGSVIDIHASVNGYWRAGTGRLEDISVLNGLFVDADCPALDHTEFVAKICEASSVGIVPPITVRCDSGCGSWAFWLFDHPVSVKRGDWHILEAYAEANRIQGRALAEKYPEMGIDKGAVDATRCPRVAGSVNSRTGRVVRYSASSLLEFGEDPPRVSFFELCEKHGVSTARPTFRKTSRRPHPEKEPKGNRREFRHLASVRCEEFERVFRSRGGLVKPSRNRGMWIAAFLYACLGHSEEEVLRLTLDLGRRCSPPVRRHQLRSSVKSACRAAKRSGGKIRNTTVAKWLEISATEADVLGLIHLRPDFKKKTRPVSTARKDRQQLRRQQLKDIILQLGRIPSVREAHRMLNDPSLGSLRTIANDLKQIGETARKEQ